MPRTPPSRSQRAGNAGLGDWGRAVAWLLPNPTLQHNATFTQRAVSTALGVGVELLELGYDQVHGTDLIADSAWDLLANTTGASMMAVTLEALLRWRRQPR